MKSATWRPATGFRGLTENWKDDVLSGFMVSLIALPLSLGIAGASNFPPVMGVFTAIVGGVVVSFITNSELTIKGPAAGLIVIVAGAVHELGKGDAVTGWHLALAAIVSAGIIQVLMGIFKLPKFADFIPLSAVYGMLTAMGIIIVSKQIHLAVGISPSELEGKGTIELLAQVPHSLMHMEYHIAIIGLISLMIMFGWKYLSFSVFKKIPPAFAALVVAVILGQFFHLFEPVYRDVMPLINPGAFALDYNADFGGVPSTLLPAFIKFVTMLVIIGSLESLLTVNTIDLLDPFKRKSDLSLDLAAVGAGNIVSGLFGGLPMISEVVRSSANVNNGAKTRWGNLFHGMFLLIFVVAFAPVLKMVPVAALAAMLIFIGFRLASPVQFYQTYDIGREQLAIFLITVAATISKDLLVGILAGILTKFIIQLINNVKLSHIFSRKIKLHIENEVYNVEILNAAVFIKYLNLKFALERIPKCKTVQINFSDSPDIDHTVRENFNRFKNDYELSGGHVVLSGFENHQSPSDDPLAARKNQIVTVMS